MVVPTATKWWIFTAANLLALEGITLQPGERVYMTGDVSANGDVFLAIANRQPQNKYETDSKQVYQVPLQALRQYLINQGETLPAQPEAVLVNVIDPATGQVKRVAGGTEPEREIVVTDSSRIGKV